MGGEREKAATSSPADTGRQATIGASWALGLSADLAGDDPSLWEPRYGDFDRQRTLDQLASLTEARPDVVTQEAVDRTIRTVHLAFDRWENPELAPRAEWAFMIPGRLTRADPRYDDELYEPFPAFAADRWAAQLILAGLPPFIVDRYGIDHADGVAIYTPVLLDMLTDLPADHVMHVLTRNVTSSIQFAASLGVQTAGLAATLPSLTQFGHAVRVEGVTTTTGHAGTTCIVRDIAQSLIATGEIEAERTPWGLLGCGSIGTAIAHGLADRYPGWPVLLADDKTERALRVERELRALGVEATVHPTRELLANCELVVSAVTTPVDLDSLPSEPFVTRVVIDDSQPSCFDADQLFARDAQLYWPIGKDDSPTGAATRVGADGRSPFLYGAGSAGMPSPSHIFGCEAEAAAIHAAASPNLALDRPVRPDDVRRMDAIFQTIGLRGADPTDCARGTFDAATRG